MKMQIRSIISAPVLHPTIAPPPISACDLGAKLITIIDLQSEVAQLATNLANLVNGGSMDHFMVAQGILDQVYNDGKNILLTRKLDTLKANLLEMKLQKLQEVPSLSTDTIPQQVLQFCSNSEATIPLQSRSHDINFESTLQKLPEAPSRSTNTNPQQTLQFHSNSKDTIPLQSQGNDINLEKTLQKLQEAPSRSADTIPQQSVSNIPPLDEDHALLDIPSAWILPHKRAHEDKRNITVQYIFTCHCGL